MKNRIVISLLAGTLALGACNLDETPYGFYSEDNFFKTAADAEAAVMYAYGTLTTWNIPEPFSFWVIWQVRP